MAWARYPVTTTRGKLAVIEKNMAVSVPVSSPHGGEDGAWARQVGVEAGGPARTTCRGDRGGPAKSPAPAALRSRPPEVSRLLRSCGAERWWGGAAAGRRHRRRIAR